jgi:hypothetical protein
MMIWGSWPSRSSCFLFYPCGADGPRGGRGRSAGGVFVLCSLCSCSAFVSIRRVFSFRLDGVSDGPRQRADGPRVPGGQSACSPRTVRGSGASLLVLCDLMDGPRSRPDGPLCWRGRSAVAGQTVRAAHRGRSALSGRTVRQRLWALLLGSIPPFLSSASACASRNRS